MLTCGRYLSSAAATTPSLSALRTLNFSFLRRHPLRFLSTSAAAAAAVEPDTRGGGGGAGGGATTPQWKAAIDFKWIRDNRDAVATNILNRNSVANLDVVLQLYDQYLALQKEVERLRAERNTVANKMKRKLDQSVRQALVDEGKNLKESLIVLEENLVQLTDKLQLEAQSIPNITHPDVPIGDEENSVIRKEVGSQRNFSFTIKDHIQLGKDLDLFDFDAASEITNGFDNAFDVAY